MIIFIAVNMSLLGRDPVRTAMDEFWGDIDPWGNTSLFYPSATSGSSGGGGRQQRRPTNRLMSMDAFETDSEFKVVVEVRIESLFEAKLNHL